MIKSGESLEKVVADLAAGKQIKNLNQEAQRYAEAEKRFRRTSPLGLGSGAPPLLRRSPSYTYTPGLERSPSRLSLSQLDARLYQARAFSPSSALRAGTTRDSVHTSVHGSAFNTNYVRALTASTSRSPVRGALGRRSARRLGDASPEARRYREQKNLILANLRNALGDQAQF